ncbi:MAG: hypothetical protein QM635_02475 [Microbacteriaceae bacterium]
MTAYTPEPAPAAPVPAPADYPGKTLGIVGLVLAFVFSLAGIIVSAIAFKQSKDAGFPNTPAKVGLILSIVFFALSVIWVVFVIIVAVAASSTDYYSSY